MTTNLEAPIWARVAETQSKIVEGLTEDEYRALPYMSASTLEHFIAGPDYYHARQTGVIADEDSPAMLFGRAFHCLVLEGPEVFNERYEVSDGPINSRTGKPFGKDTNAYRDWLVEQKVGIDIDGIISFSEYDTLIAMRNAIDENEHAAQLLDPVQDIATEVAIVGKIAGIDAKGRVDAIDAGRRLIVDVKTSADCETIGKYLPKYARQLAFYRELVAGLIGPDPIDAFLVVVDKTVLHRVRVLQIGQATNTAALAEIGDAIARYKHCLALGYWPSPYTEVEPF